MSDLKRGLTTHVLDTTAGKPAAGVAITLHGPDGVTAEAVTNADGRTDGPLVDTLVDGTYELTFDVGSYFADEAYLGLVPVRVNLTAAMGDAYVALLVTPWSYSTYRGS